MNTATTAVLFTRKHNENSTTAADPVGTWLGQVDLSETGDFCVSSDFDMSVSCPLYEVREVSLPAWLSAEEWASNVTTWKYTWGAGVSMEWSESWQRGLKACDFRTRYLVCKLLTVKAFRSEFRRSLRDQAVAWLETPAAERRTASPLSPRQLDCLEFNAFEVKRAQERLYSTRAAVGRLLTTQEAHAVLENQAANTKAA